MKKLCYIIVLCCTLISSTLSLSQNGYKAQWTTYQPQDVTSWGNTVNLWKPLGTAPPCQPNTSWPAIDGSLVSCIGTNGYIYEWLANWVGSNHQWTEHTEFGAPGFVSVQFYDQTHAVAWFHENCPTFYAQPYWWINSAWTVNPDYGCVKSPSLSTQGQTTFGIGTDNKPYANVYGSGVWTGIAGGWSVNTAWTYLNMADKDHGCAVNQAALYILDESTNATLTAFNPSPGTIQSCSHPQNGWLVVLGASGAQWYDYVHNTWLTMSGHAAWQGGSAVYPTYLNAGDQGLTIASDSSGVLWHYNLYVHHQFGNLNGNFSAFMGPGYSGSASHEVFERPCIGTPCPATFYQTSNWNATFSMPFDVTGTNCDPTFEDPLLSDCLVQSASGNPYFHCSRSGNGGVSSPGTFHLIGYEHATTYSIVTDTRGANCGMFGIYCDYPAAEWCNAVTTRPDMHISSVRLSANDVASSKSGDVFARTRGLCGPRSDGGYDCSFESSVVESTNPSFPRQYCTCKSTAHGDCGNP